MNRFRLLSVLMLLVTAACTAPPPAELPTLAALPSATLAPAAAAAQPTVQPTAPLPAPTQTPTERASATEAAPPAASSTPSPTEPPSASSTPSNTPAPTTTPTPSATQTPTETRLPTLTPSLTITNTITPSPSPSFTPSPELGLLGELAALSARATILPPELLYNPPTLTALYLAGQQRPATLGAATSAALLPTVAPSACTLPVPAGAAAVLALDAGFAGLIGCPVIAAPFPSLVAAQAFERGVMIYVQGAPNAIFTLTSDNRFRRFNDTWLSGVDPEFLPDLPPPGLLAPKRGFGKVWATFPDVRAQLGWALSEEAGAAGALLPFERGRAVAVPQRGEIILMADDPGGGAGFWRAAFGGL